MLVHVVDEIFNENDLFSVDEFNFAIVNAKDVSDMDCESPRSSTSMEIGELNSPGQILLIKEDNEIAEDNANNNSSSSEDEHDVQLPPGV